MSLGTQLAMLATLIVTSKGVAGVPSASLVVIASTLSQFGIPEAGLLMIMGIDTFLDMGRSATNVIGDSLATAVVAKWEGELAPEHALGPDDVVPPDVIPGEVPGMQPGHASEASHGLSCETLAQAIGLVAAVVLLATAAGVQYGVSEGLFSAQPEPVRASRPLRPLTISARAIRRAKSVPSLDTWLCHKGWSPGTRNYSSGRCLRERLHAFVFDVVNIFQMQLRSSRQFSLISAVQRCSISARPARALALHRSETLRRLFDAVFNAAATRLNISTFSLDVGITDPK